MLSVDPRPPLVVILGPTAVGKTETALQLAERFGGEIVSADSRLFYRGMDVGTAKPTPAELARVPHHLINVAHPSETWSLAMFQRAARQAIAQINARGRLPFLVGGTGQYIRAVTEGWQIPEAAPNPGLRHALQNWGAQLGPIGLHNRLALLDPEAARRIDPPNIRRTIRALEVIFLTGERFSAQKTRQTQSPYRLLQLGLTRPRPELYARIDSRIEAMFAAGLVGEVRSLLASGCPAEAPALSAIGYRQVVAHLRGAYDLAEAIRQIQRDTRQFVRRQANWFKLDDPTIHWFEAGEDPLPSMEAAIEAFLAQPRGV